MGDRLFEAEANLEVALLELFRAHGWADDDLPYAVDRVFDAIDKVLTPESVETRCVPLCGADRAAGIPVDWWMHENLCPARDGRKPGTKQENVESSRRESALDVARRLGHELPTEAEQRARIDREFPTRTSENVECPVVDENGNHPVEHDGAECWHCGAKPENVDTP